MDCIENPHPVFGEEKPEWILLTGSEMDYQAKILCGRHLEEYIQIEGEMNLDFKHLDNHIWFDVIEKLNKELRRASKRYHDIIIENRELKKKLTENVEGISPHLLPNKTGLERAMSGIDYAHSCLRMIKKAIEEGNRGKLQ